MKKFFFISIGAFIANFLSGQNLVPNGDFSKMINPPSNNNMILHNIFEDWFIPTVEGAHSGIISYKITDPAFSINIPMRPPYFYPSPTVDSSYCIIGAWKQTTVGVNSRMYISTRLSETIEIGKYYSFSMDFHLSTGINSIQFCNNLGMAFTDSLSVNVRQLIPEVPVFNIDTPVMTPNTWFSVDTCLIANRTADFMTIGNFFDDNNTILSTRQKI